MPIDEIAIRTQIWKKTFTILRNNDVLDFQIVDNFQDRYKEYNKRVHNVDTLKYLPNRGQLVLQREKDIALDILKEHNIPDAELYFQCN